MDEWLCKNNAMFEAWLLWAFLWYAVGQIVLIAGYSAISIYDLIQKDKRKRRKHV